MPDLEILSTTYISLSLVSLAQFPSRSIQVVNRGVLPQAGQPGVTYTLFYVGYQGSAPTILPWQNVPLVTDALGNFTFTLNNPIPNATYVFYLNASSSIGKGFNQSFSPTNIATGANDIYNPDSLLPDMKIQMQKEYNLMISAKTSLLNQATYLNVSSSISNAYTTALANLDAQLNFISDWNSTTHVWNSTASTTYLAVGGLVSLQSYITAANTAQTNLAYAISVADQAYRSINGLDGTSTYGRVWYRGSIDISTRGGAPNIANFAIQSNYEETSNGLFNINLYLRPTSISDNFDSMRYANIAFYRGTTASATLIMTKNVPLTDRLYANATDSNAANVSASHCEWRNGTVSGILSGDSPRWYLLVTIYNAYGPSDTKWFVPPSTLNTDWTQQTSAPYTGGGSGGSGGGGGGAGGGCPTPDTLLDLADGSQLAAKDIQVGMRLSTLHEASEDTGAYAEYPVEAVEPDTNEVWGLTLEDGRYLEFAGNHRFLTPWAWIELQALTPGVPILGSTPGVVKTVTKVADVAPVIKITVTEAHTYQTSGLISHNMKAPS